MIRTLSAVAAAVLSIGFGAVALAQAPDGGLPAGPGHDTLMRVCSACHAPELVVDKRLDYAGWDEIVQMMAGRGAVASDAEFKEVTEYLAKNFPAPGTAPAAPAPAAAAPAAPAPVASAAPTAPAAAHTTH